MGDVFIVFLVAVISGALGYSFGNAATYPRSTVRTVQARRGKAGRWRFCLLDRTNSVIATGGFFRGWATSEAALVAGLQIAPRAERTVSEADDDD